VPLDARITSVVGANCQHQNVSSSHWARAANL